jgi:hypothetical protein
MKYPKISEIKIPVNYSLGKTGCTQSLVHTFKTCPLKFLLKINKWQSKKGQEKALIGNINHYVLSYLYRGSKTNIRSLINAYFRDNADTVKFIDKEFIEYAKVISFVTMTIYQEFYDEDFDTAKFTNTEREFAVEIFGVLWRGKIDGEHTVKKDRSLWILETKNKGRINEENVIKGLSMDFQGRMYTKAKEVEFKKRVSGFIYNIIRIPASKPHKGETIISFQNRMIEEIRKKPEYYFLRWQVPLTEEDKKDFDFDLTNIVIALQDFIKKMQEKTCKCERNTFACTEGFVPCEYLDACIQGDMVGYFQDTKIFSELNCGI